MGSSETSPPPNGRVPAAIRELAASGPVPELAARLMLYGQFVGSWKIDAADIAESGDRHERTGRWHFAWILGGRGIQDVLYADGASPDRYGTTIRCYDEQADVWHVSWMAPAGGEFVHLVGRRVDDRIVQIGNGPDPARTERWTFSDIRPDSFLWQGEVSFDHGRTWRLIQEMRATRINS